MKHWHIDDIGWERFTPNKVEPAVVPLIKAAAMVERNGLDYARYLNNVFHDDPAFRDAADHWATEEVQHGDALGRWATLADPTWDFEAAFARYQAGYKVPIEVQTSVRGSRTGELIARCIVETGTSSYYTALADATDEPVLREVCRQIASDEYRHFKLFYDHMHRYLRRERIGVARRLKIAAGRVTESEDDELAFAFHCGNDMEDVPYDHASCVAGYFSGAIGFYQLRHIERGMGMIFKSVGLPPRGRLSGFVARLAWFIMQRRRRRFERLLTRDRLASA